MRFINRGRGNCKTTMLVFTAYVTGKPLIVPQQQMKKFTLDTARKMGVEENVQIFTLNEWLKIGRRLERSDGVLIDNVDMIIEDILSKYLGTPITAGTMNIPMVSKIVNQVDEEHNNGWIPCNERLPEEGVSVNITYKNSNPPSYYSNIKNIPFTATAILYKNKWYWYSCICLNILNEYGKNEADAVNKDIDIIAWQPLPEPYREEQEDE